MLASQSTKTVELPGGGTAVIRKLTDREWSTFCRLARDAKSAAPGAEQDTKGDAADNFVLSAGVVALNGASENLTSALDDVTEGGLPYLIHQVLAHTKPDILERPDDAQKNDSGPSVDTSTVAGHSPTSSGSATSVRSSTRSHRK